MSNRPSREDAFQLLTTYTKTDSLIKHALAVEGVMRFLAKKTGNDEEQWGIIGLVHDLDYEQFPTEHCQHTEKILQDAGWPATYVRAVMSHAYGTCTDIKPESLLEKYLYAIDELTGLIATTALVRPSKKVAEVKIKSVKKKWKDKRFAAGVDRSIIQNGAEMLGVPLEELMQDTIDGMTAVAPAIGLAGE